MNQGCDAELPSVSASISPYLTKISVLIYVFKLMVRVEMNSGDDRGRFNSRTIEVRIALGRMYFL